MVGDGGAEVWLPGGAGVGELIATDDAVAVWVGIG